jgi:hypothetical protein
MRHYKFIGSKDDLDLYEWDTKPALRGIYSITSLLSMSGWSLSAIDSMLNTFKNQWEEFFVFDEHIEYQEKTLIPLYNKSASEMTVFEKLVCDLVIHSDFQDAKIAIKKAKEIIQAIEKDK